MIATRVDTDISDLFFNTSHDRYPDADSVEDVYPNLREEAHSFLVSLSRVSGIALPSDDDLIADFFGRL